MYSSPDLFYLRESEDNIKTPFLQKDPKLKEKYG
jgi:hypothetical protein